MTNTLWRTLHEKVVFVIEFTKVDIGKSRRCDNYIQAGQDLSPGEAGIHLLR